MKVTAAKALDGFKLQLSFENGEQGVVDLAHLAGRGVTLSWNDRSVFESVRVTNAGAVEWPGDVDICGDSLYLRATGKQPEQLFPRLSTMTNA